MFRRLQSFLACLLVLTLMVALVPAQPASAAEELLTDEEAIDILMDYEIVRGDPIQGLMLDSQLTRAQAAALFVRSLGQEETAGLLKDVVPFWDAKGHWAAGEIALAERMKLMKGDGGGTFRPNDPITYAEVLTVLLRMVEREPQGPWNPATIVSAANGLKLAPAGIDGRTPALRGKIFWSLAQTTATVEVDGQTLLQRHHTKPAPVLKIDRVTSPTTESNATISGTAAGAFRLFVNGKMAKLDRQTGRFSHQVALNVGTNEIKVDAYNAARNRVSEVVKIDRRGNASRLTVTGTNLFKISSTSKLTITATDSSGKDVSLEGLQHTITGDVATFNPKTLTLTTGSKIGRGTLTLTLGSARTTFSFEVQGQSSKVEKLAFGTVNSGRAPGVNKEVTVTVQALDASGRVVTDDFFRPVTLQASGLSGVTVTPSTAMTEKGVATFTVKSTREGEVTLRASSGSLTSIETSLEFLSGTRVVLSSTVKSLKPDGISTATIRATLTDEDGRAITNNTAYDIQIDLTANGTDGELTDSYISIPRGKSNSSGNDGVFQVGILPGTVKISGTFFSDHKYSIQTLNLPIDSPLSGTQIQITYSPTNPKPTNDGTGDEVTVTLKVVDGSNRVVTTGSYAFQLSLSTSNDDKVTAGMPDGVSLRFKGSDYYPVDDGYAPNHADNDPNSVVGRTDKGIATMTLRYTKSGVVKITPVLKGATSEAYNPVSGMGPASPTTGLYAPAREIAFAGAPAKIQLYADSAGLGKDQPAGAVSTSSTVTVRARVLDLNNTPIPGYRQTVTLVRETTGDGISSISGMNKKTTVDGVAEFTVQATSTEGYDLYTASIGTLKSDPITIAVRKKKADAPYVVAVRGAKKGDLSPVTGYVEPDHDYMMIQLQPMDPPSAYETGYWVTAKVYRKSDNRLIYTSGAFDISNPVPVIRVPRSALKAGTDNYEVIINNGAGDSARSAGVDELSQATVIDYSTSYKLTSATYDGATQKLTLSGSGLVTNGEVHLDKLSIVKDGDSMSIDGEAKVNSSSTITITLANPIDPDRFHGTVYVKADLGWFTNNTDTQVAKEYPEIPLKPMAAIFNGALDVSGQRLYLNGEGLKQGSLNLALVAINGTGNPVKLRPGSSSSYDRVTSYTDSQIIISLSKATFDAIQAIGGPGSFITADTGWLYSGSSSSGPKVGAIEGTNHPLYLRVTVNSASYDRVNDVLTLKGSGLTGASVDTSKLIFRRNASSPAWSPKSAGFVTADSDTEIVIPLGADAAEFEKVFEAGRNVFMNTSDGWLQTSSGWEATAIPDYSVLFTMPR